MKILIVSLLLFGFITLLSFAEGVAEADASAEAKKPINLDSPCLVCHQAVTPGIVHLLSFQARVQRG